ncbi:MAG: alpha/beta hydrolase [Planctomycetes bacterium]|nr:alpha/beta hydrolase [Planctomycetota bacterium]MBU4398528.1 alpha/beta hydrolase [Planctomycetota bacterium]
MNQFFVHDNIRFCYQVIGKGPPVVFCHGLGGDLEAPKELVGVPDNYQLIVWDSRGHGGTEPLGPIDALTFASFAGDLAALLGHLQIREAVVGGISMGAGVAAQLALRHVVHIWGLVLVRPASLEQPLPKNLALFPRIAKLLGDLGSESGLVEFLRFPEVAAMKRVSPGAVDSLIEQFRKPQAVERRARLDRIPRDRPIVSWEPIEQLDIPALVVGTGHDPLHPLDMAATWARHLAKGRLANIPSKYESPEQHVRQFRRHLNSFLKSVIP